MNQYGGRRTKAEQDAFVVEVGYALFSGMFAAGVVFGAVAGPALLFDLPRTVEPLLWHGGKWLAVAIFGARVISVLLRHRRASQPSQPGRTNPDS
ncbi:putative membrane protein [Streptomyces davaonensis JCM 4913]|uniref:Putative membrane protein n=1 Tax=Streptomyces davaonensis (strain DSM 101723 / JCM 4913 / KCC S-0913 / 768) TaxID=1214101 RepID=K4R7H7_STRDJ|nr:DUF6332 family protein [Streptomyces davaonensis]CCK32231.1 putative membrane protein [Streptomyces davaonensis JCM 4913]